MNRLRGLAATAALLTTAAISFQPAPAQAAPVATSTFTSTTTSTNLAIANKLFDLTNAERRKAGVPPLVKDACLHTSAQHWSNHMASVRRMYHSDLKALMTKCKLWSAGENVARGGATPERTIQMWMASPGHRANILNPKYTKLGVGWNANGSYATQQFGR